MSTQERAAVMAILDNWITDLTLSDPDGMARAVKKARLLK